MLTVLLALLKGEEIDTGLCPVYEFLNGEFKVLENGELSGTLVEVDRVDFAPGFALIYLPLSEQDKQELEEIRNGKPLVN